MPSPTDFADAPPRSAVFRLRAAIRALRPHQWIKNALLFVPLLLAHEYGDPGVWLAAVLGFVAFSCCSSSAYVINDLADREADRLHPTKRHRPFASGALSPAFGVVLGAALLVVGLAIAWLALPGLFLLILITYVLTTLTYSAVIKRIVIADVLVLAGLYMLRVLAGGAATDIVVSHWLLAFAVFFFLSLALLKRYVELRSVELSPGTSVAGRGYGADDVALLRSVGPSAGIVSIFVLVLYLTGPDVIVLYRHPAAIAVVGGLLLYWILRMWMLAHRGTMDDDPVLFAARDRVSHIIGVLSVLTLALAAS